jgi:hypothetical protein
VQVAKKSMIFLLLGVIQLKLPFILPQQWLPKGHFPLPCLFFRVKKEERGLGK